MPAGALSRMTRADVPVAIDIGGVSFVTTLLAASTTPSPIVTLFTTIPRADPVVGFQCRLCLGCDRNLPAIWPCDSTAGKWLL
jgi:hypothetical protein